MADKPFVLADIFMVSADKDAAAGRERISRWSTVPCACLKEAYTNHSLDYFYAVAAVTNSLRN